MCVCVRIGVFVRESVCKYITPQVHFKRYEYMSCML